MKNLRGAVIRRRKKDKRTNEREEVFVYSLRRGRKHPWFHFCGYSFTRGKSFVNVADGYYFEEEYEVIVQYTIDEMLTHDYEKVRQVGMFLSENPKLKDEHLLSEIRKTFTDTRSPS